MPIAMTGSTAGSGTDVVGGEYERLGTFDTVSSSSDPAAEFSADAEAEPVALTIVVFGRA